MSSTRKLIEAVAAVTFDDLSAVDVDAVRDLFLDHIGVTARGASSTSAAVFRATFGSLDAPSLPQLAVIGTDTVMGAVAAAMANAVAAHSIELDDLHNASSSHPGVVIFPAVLAAAVLSGADEAAFIAGVVAGYEVMCRVGRAADPAALYERNFHPTAVAGGIGAAVAAGTILGLDVGGLVAAAGIAASNAAGSMQFLLDGAWTKRLHPAMAARNGLEAALLAANGFIGTTDGIAGDRGFLASYSERGDPKQLLADWRLRPLEVRSTGLKAHACCRYNHSPIDAALALRAAHAIEADQIRAVVIGVPAAAVDLVAEPIAAKRRPSSVVEAQFSLPFGVAVALAHGESGLGWYRDQVLGDRTLLDLMDRISYVMDPAIDARFPERWGARATLTLRDGRELTATIDDPRGDPANPLSHGEVVAKFEDLTMSVFSDDRRQRIVGLVDALGAHATLPTLLHTLAVGD